MGVLAAAAALGLMGVAPAYGDSPWWHLSSASRPTYLQAGQARDEVQRLTVEANEGTYVLERPGIGLALFQAGENPEQVQRALEEELYGKGNVHVTGGPGPGGNNPYEVYAIEFVHALADQPVQLAAVPQTLDNLKRSVGGKEVQGHVSIGEVTTGRPDGQIVVTAVNLGDTSADPAIQPIALADRLPPGLKAVAIEGYVDERLSVSFAYPLECSLGSLSCTFTGKSSNGAVRVPPYEQIQMRISVNLKGGAESGEVNRVSVTGGGAPGVSAERAIALGEGPAQFGVSTYEMRPEEAGGALDTQAGSHPFQLTTTIGFNEDYEGKAVEGKPLGGSVAAMTKDLHFDLPPGLIGNPTPFAQCPLGEFLRTNGGVSDNCSAQTVVGVARLSLNVPGIGPTTPFVVPLFNIVPAIGEPARFGFLVYGVPVLLNTAVRTGGDYGVTVNVTNISQEAEFLGSEVTFWGVPGRQQHDASRNWECLDREQLLGVGDEVDANRKKCQPLEASKPPPLLSMPPSCTGVTDSTVEGDSWVEPRNSALLATASLPAMDGCNELQFSPSIEVAPDSLAGSTPTGLAVRVRVPQEVSVNADGLAEADVKNTTVALPVGVAINPAGGDGLEACSEAQIALKSAEPPSCPDASKVGLVKIKTPLLPNLLEGAAYLASQNANPFGSLVALYVFVEDPISGSRVKLAGEVVPDPVTGQLVSTFKDTPELPFETFELHFFGGDRAPLASPAFCGAYTTTASIEPSTATGAVDSSSTFDITSGPASFDEPAGRPCPGARLPFDPSLTGGALNIDAGAFSPFTLTMTRKDGEQNLQSVEAKLPPGVSGILSNVELCREPQANLGECPPGSLIGETTVSVGVGGDPFSVAGGKFYLTGPYNGSGSCVVGTPGCAPFGITFEVPAKAGPFDLKRNTANPAGEDPCDCVIVRGKIEVNPVTAAVTITSDPPGSPYAIPTSIEGIPLEIQHVNAITTRNDFQFNPTNCEQMAVTGTIHSSENTTDTLSIPFQVTNCALLAFKPAFKLSTSGKTSRRKGASLSVHLTYPRAPFGSQANIKSVKVDLPKQLPSNLKTLQNACPHQVFEANPSTCPAASKVGSAKAITPLIPVPLEGPAYFVSYGGAKFPELVIVLQGYGVTLDLHGETFINERTGITSSTFHTVPDAPVGSFELTLPQGPFSALDANTNLCTVKGGLHMPTLFTAQNGATIKQNTPIGVTGCPKQKAHKTKGKKAAHNTKWKGTTR